MNQVVWSERYDRALDDTFELQDEITARVLTAINVKLVAGEQAKIWHRTLKDLKALELFYKGVHAFLAMERDEMVRARQLFEKVVRMRPEVSTGATWVALTHWFDIQRGWSDAPETSRALARKFAEQAVAMGYSDGQAQTALSHIYLMEGNHEAALKAGRQAVTDRPACANANAFYANVLHYCGAQDDAIRHINLATRFQPLHPPFFRNILAAAHLAKGAPEAAISAAQQALEFAPTDITARLIQVSAYIQSRRPELARRVAAEVTELDPAFSVADFTKAQYYRNADFLAQYAADLRAAGLPE